MANYKLVDTDQLETDLKTVADAIREKGGTTEQLAFPDGMASAVEAIQAGGGDTRFKGLIEGTNTELYGEDVTKIASNAFYNNSTITKAIFPNVESIGQYAFYQASKLAEISFPKATTVYSYAFQMASKLVSVSFDSLVHDSNNPEYGFLQGCSKLERANFPKLVQLHRSQFSSCAVLTEILIPSATILGRDSFSGCRSLVQLNAPSANNIQKNCFNSCCSLKALLLRNTSKVCYLAYADAFTNCYHYHGTVDATYNPDGLKDGYIYVPRALIEDYKVATNWTTLADQFRALEDYTVDGTTTGEMDWDKINGGAS